MSWAAAVAAVGIYVELWLQAAAEVADIACPKAGSRENGVLMPWDGRSPLSIAAAIIYLVTRLPKVPPPPSPVNKSVRLDAANPHRIHSEASVLCRDI